MTESIVPAAGVAARRARRARRGSEMVVRALLSRARRGTLILRDARGTRRYGQGAPTVHVTVHDARAFDAVLRAGSVGFGESYVDGWWDGDDLTAVVRFVIANVNPLLRRVDSLTRFVAPVSRARQRFERVDRERDRANIRAHYDLGNDFYALMLDDTMMYSCAYFADETTSLGDASRAKLDKLCVKLRLGPRDHVLEIGSGWGGFATYAAEHYGCRVTAVTISDAQFEYTRALIRERHLEHLVQVRNQDYRDVTGTFDKLVSIEMIEAVGWRQLDTYFATCARLLAPEGVMALQAITINDASYERTKNRDDFIKRMIFPGGFLPSLDALVRASAVAGGFRVIDLEDLGRHYAETLSRWRDNLALNVERVRALGRGEAFDRMWHMYLCYCEAAFLERHISDVQLVLTRAAWPAPLGASVPR